MSSGNEKEAIFNQECAEYLGSLGVEIQENKRINAPYRPEADSESFIVNGPFFADHSHGIKGNVWELALLMHNNDRLSAIKSLYKSAGIPSIEQSSEIKALSEKEKAEAVLVKVRKAFAISNTTPDVAVKYLEKRKVGDKSLPLFSYIPTDEALQGALTDEETEAVAIKSHVGRIIMWYIVGGKPVYYASRSIEGKDFRKACLSKTALSHPIWNVDDLYSKPTVIWAEGMFDCASLVELGYGVCGEVTCNLIERHYRTLLTALRWRAKYQPAWEFIICLDNDEEKQGRRAGNEEAEKLAVRLWADGINCKWVKHNPQSEKVDINQLHMAGKEAEIHQMIMAAQKLNDLLPADEELLKNSVTSTLNHGDYRTAEVLLKKLESQTTLTFPKLIRETLEIRRPWKEFYNGIEDLFVDDGDVYVVFQPDHYGQGQKHYDIKSKLNAVDELHGHQVNPLLKLKWQMLDIFAKRPEWRVAKDKNKPDSPLFNLFSPSPLLTQKPVEGTELPTHFNLLLDNLAGRAEKEWLLNHMAYYVQHLEKLPTIPVMLGPQGTGKNTLMTLFGKGVGGFCRVDNSLLETDFNEWMLHPVILLDELVSSSRDANKMKNKIKGLCNLEQSINIKGQRLHTLYLNNYIAIASNEQTTYPPIIIEPDDRRYSIICGGRDKKLTHESWFNYRQLESELPQLILHLLSRPVDEKKAYTPLMNEKKAELIGLGEDTRITIVREWLDEGRYSIESVEKLSSVVAAINLLDVLKTKFTSRTLKPILGALGFTFKQVHNQDYVQGVSVIAYPPETSSATTSTMRAVECQPELGLEPKFPETSAWDEEM